MSSVSAAAAPGLSAIEAPSPGSSAYVALAWWVGWWALFQAVHAAARPTRLAKAYFGGGRGKDGRVLAQNVVASVHAAVSTVLSLYCVSRVPLADLVSPEFGQPALFQGAVRDWTRRILEMTIGYMAYDLVETGTDGEGALSLAALRRETAMALHHVLVIVSYKLALDYGVGAYLPILLEIAECSTPLYHLRWFLLKTGRDEASSATTRWVSYLFFGMFIAVRGVFYGFLAAYPMFNYWRSNAQRPAHVATILVGFAFVSLNFYWCALALRKMLRHMAGDPAALKRTHRKPAKAS
jgi:TLC domain-containing protein